MTIKFADRVKVSTSSTGTGTISLGSAVDGFQTFAQGGILNGNSVRYTITNGDSWEVGTGVYSSSGTQMTRSYESSSTGSLLNLSGTSEVFITVASADINTLADTVPKSTGGQFDSNVDFAAGIDVTGNITVTGTVDGRDVATDGTKLDGIEASATADQTAAEILTAIKTVDGNTSGLDADLLDGQHGSYYTGYADTAVANLVDSAPSTLDTLNELAAALGDDPNFGTTVTNSLAAKLPLAGGTMTGSIRLDQDALSASGGTLTMDLNAANNFKITMSANTTFAFSNVSAGRGGNLIIVQNATGGHSFTLPAACKTPVNGASIVQSTNANEISILSYYVVDSSNILVNYIGDFA